MIQFYLQGLRNRGTGRKVGVILGIWSNANHGVQGGQLGKDADQVQLHRCSRQKGVFCQMQETKILEKLERRKLHDVFKDEVGRDSKTTSKLF